MIKAIIKDDSGKKTLLLGLSRKNINNLLLGKPILVSGEAVNLDNDVFIMFGETEKDIIKILKETGFELPDVPKIDGGVRCL